MIEESPGKACGCPGQGRGERLSSYPGLLTGNCVWCSGEGGITCPECEGAGEIGCDYCHGESKVECPNFHGSGWPIFFEGSAEIFTKPSE